MQIDYLMNLRQSNELLIRIEAIKKTATKRSKSTSTQKGARHVALNLDQTWAFATHIIWDDHRT